MNVAYVAMKTPASLCLILCVAANILFQQGVAAAEPARDRVTIVILDQSGSMGLAGVSDGTDPEGLRCSAIRLLADLGTTSDTLGLIRLSSQDSTNVGIADVLLPPQRMGNREASQRFKDKVDCLNPQNYTPMADSLRKAYEQLAAVEQERGSKSFEGRVLLLTDGEPAPDPTTQIAEIDQILPTFASKSWPVSTIGLRLSQTPMAIELLQKIAVETKGTLYGDVEQPLELQNIFVEFFAQQTGRSFLPGSYADLSPYGEFAVNVADYATHIDILVAKGVPEAAISLQRPDLSEVSEQGQGVQIFGDPYYAVFSITDPMPGRWSVHTNQDTPAIVNMLVDSSLSVRLENGSAIRASNQPLILIARFYNKDLNGDIHPVSIQNAAVTAIITVQGLSSTIQLHDDGQSPDQVANDGLYSGIVMPGLDANDTHPVTASVSISAQSGDARYTDQTTIQLVAVPQVVLDEDTVRLAPESQIDVPLHLQIGKQQIDIGSWSLKVRQLVAGTMQPLDVRLHPNRFVVTLVRQPDEQQPYNISVDLIGINHNDGLEWLGQTMALRVVFVPTLKLYYEGVDTVPVGRPITLTAALLKSFNQAVPGEPLRLTVEHNDKPTQVITSVQAIDQGHFSYTFSPPEPGRYRFTLLPPADQALDPQVREITVAALPEVRWQTSVSTDDSLLAYPAQWIWLDQLRRIPLLGWLLTLPLGSYQSEPTQLGGTVVREGQPYSGTATLALLRPDGTTVLSDPVAGGSIAARWQIPPGDYQLSLTIPDAFPPGVQCCQTSTRLHVIGADPPLDQRIAACLILWLEALPLLGLRWLTSPRPKHGDKLFITVHTGPQPTDLAKEQTRFMGFLRPRRINLTPSFQRRGGTKAGWPKSGVVHMTREGITFEREPVPPKDTMIKGHRMRYEPSKPPKRSPSPPSPRTSHRRHSRPTPQPGLWRQIHDWLTAARRGPSKPTGKSSAQRYRRK
ncbi:MAG: choice-of-anchor X domain-containing protein [Chloroflexales bacterium]